MKIGDMTVRPFDKLVTYVSRDLEPYRGFHVMMRALPDLLRARPDVKVVMIGGDGISYGAAPRQGRTWREVLMAEVGGQLDPDRVAFPGRVSYATYRTALRRSDAHVYLTYPFVASWSLREALAIGCPVVGSDTSPVREFITHGDNGLLTPFLEPAALARTVLCLLDDKPLARKLRTSARAYAERRLGMNDYLNSYVRVIARLTGKPRPQFREGTFPLATRRSSVRSTRRSVPFPRSRRRAAAPPAAPDRTWARRFRLPIVGEPLFPKTMV